jgi:hypothetical protein
MLMIHSSQSGLAIGNNLFSFYKPDKQDFISRFYFKACFKPILSILMYFSGCVLQQDNNVRNTIWPMSSNKIQF